MMDSSDYEILPASDSQAGTPSTDLVYLLSRKVVGQSSATKAIVPFVYMYQSGLKLLRCDEGQGYFYGKPMPADVFEETLRCHPQEIRNAVIAGGQNESEVEKGIEVAR